MKTMKSGEIQLSKAEHEALVEALRRRTRFARTGSHVEEITKQWTGLGTNSEYRGAVNSGLMVCESENPRYSAWWKLTDRGARIVSYWIGQGFSYTEIESGRQPNSVIPAEVLL